MGVMDRMDWKDWSGMFALSALPFLNSESWKRDELSISTGQVSVRPSIYKSIHPCNSVVWYCLSNLFLFIAYCVLVLCMFYCQFDLVTLVVACHLQLMLRVSKPKLVESIKAELPRHESYLWQRTPPQTGCHPCGKSATSCKNQIITTKLWPFNAVIPTLNITVTKYGTPPKFNSSPLKNGGWKTTFLLGR